MISDPVAKRNSKNRRISDTGAIGKTSEASSIHHLPSRTNSIAHVTCASRVTESKQPARYHRAGY
jgi:hypothetical protein